MAVKDCDKVSNIIAVAIAAGDDALSQEIANLSAIKNEALQKSRALGKDGKVDPVTGLTAHELELRASSSDIKIRAIVQASILKGQKGAEAFFELARQIDKTKGSLAGGTILLEKLNNASMASFDEVARLWDNTMDVNAAMEDLRNGLAEFVASNYSIRKYSDFFEGAVAKAKKKLKEGKISNEQYKTEVEKAHKQAMKKIDKGENPTDFIPLDKEWQAIKKVFGDNPKEAGRIWTQYAMAREILSDGGLDDDLLVVFETKGEMLLGPLTTDWIAKCNDLDQLLARAFTNTEQLYNDGILREVYRNKITELASGKRIDEKNIRKVKTLINVSLFAEEGATLSDVLLDNRAYLSAKQMGLKVTEKDGGKIYDGLRSFARSLADGKDKDILDGPIKIGPVEMDARQIVQLIYDVTGDRAIIQLMNAGNFPDGAILNVATQKLLGNNDKAQASLLKLFKKGKEGTKITNPRGVFLKAITGIEVPDNAPIAFFDYRKGLYFKDELSSAYADFMDKLAEKNKMRVGIEGIDDITTEGDDKTKEVVEKLYKTVKKKVGGGFLIVNDSGYKDNPLLRKALNMLKEDEQVTILYPRGGAAANFAIGDGGIVYYKTIDDGMYDRVAGTVSIQSLGDAKPTREILADVYEAQTGRNGDKLRYQPSYRDGGVDNLGRQISDQQVEYKFYSNSDKNPITFYHWTKAKFDEFSLDHFREGNGDSLILGFYFTTDKDVKLGEKLKDADTLIEVYLKMDNPIDGTTRLQDLFTYDDLIQLFKDYHNSIGSTFDEERWGYKISEWIGDATHKGTTIKGFLENAPEFMGYQPFFGDGRAFMEFFTRRTGIDGIKVSDIEYIVFSPNQIKSVDNRLPTDDSRMMFQERELDENEGSLTDAQFETIKSLLIDQREKFSSRGYEELIRNIMISDPNRFVRAVNYVLSDKKKYAAQVYDLYVIVQKEREIWQAILNNSKNGKVLVEPFTKDYWETYEAIDTIYKDLKSAVGRRKKTAGLKAAEDEKYRELEGFKGAQFSEVLGRIADNGHFPIELGIVIDDNGKIISIGRGGPSSIGGVSEIPGGTFYHSHPENGWFSGGYILGKGGKLTPKGGDLNTFFYEKEKFPKVGLINPGGLILEFNNTPNFLKYADLVYNDLIQAINFVGPNYDSRIGTVQTALVVSLMTKEFEKQQWGIYADIIGDYKNDVRKIVDKYLDENNALNHILSPEDRKELNRIGTEIKEKVAALDMEIMINGPSFSVDSWIGEMFKDSDRFDNFGRKLTYGQKRYGFATVGDVEQLDDEIKFGDHTPSQAVARAYYIRGDDMGYVVDFKPFKGHQASYIRFDPDNIVRSDDEFSRLVEEDTINEYLGTHILGLHYSEKLRDLLKSKTATIKEVMDEVSLHYRGPELFKAMMLDVGIEGYYDSATKSLKLFDFSAVKDANNLYPKSTTSRYFQYRRKQYAAQRDLTPDEAMKVQMFTKDRTWKQIADGYGFPVKIVQGDMIEGVKAYGAWGKGFIQFTDLIKESTAPHELFHAVFNTWVGKEEYDQVLEDGRKLFGGISARDMEEILADEFAHWFNTGEFTYGDRLLKLSGKKKLTKSEKTFVDKVLQFFEDLAEALGLLDEHRNQVEAMFKGIVNMDYLPDAGKAVNAGQAMVRYNDELNKAAIKYFGQVLGESSEVIDEDYVRRVETLLSDMLGIDIKAFDLFSDKSQLWQRINKQLTLEKLTVGRFDKQIADADKIKTAITNATPEKLAEDINAKFGVLVKGGRIADNENIDQIREAWFEYNTARNTADLLAAKGRIIGLANGTNPQTLTLADLKKMFMNKSFIDTYKEMFFPKQELSEEDEALFIRQINSDIFDGLSVAFAENLVNAGYSLPLINCKKLVYDYLNGTLDLNSDFVQAFFFKNDIPFTKDNLDTIMDTMMPKDYKFDFNGLNGSLTNPEIGGDISRVIEIKNRFLPDSYSALYAIEDSGRGITLGDKETKVLGEMLDKYIRLVKEGMSKGTLKFGDAQKLKQELAYALDVFEQDFILPKYGQFLTPQQRQDILGTKYDIPIGVTGQPINKVETMLNEAKERVMGTYDRVLGTMVDNADINAAIARGYNADTTPEALQERIERRRNQLISEGSTIKEVNGEYVVYRSKDALWETINTLPDNIEGVAGLKALGREEIERMPNKQAYILLRYLEATKALTATADIATQLMYKQNPQLAKYAFFTSYAIDETTKLPKVMKGNALGGDELFNIASASTVDQEIKREVFEKVIKKFKRDGFINAHTSEAGGEGLSEIIEKAITRQIDEMESIKFTPENKELARSKMQNIYTNMFIPYTYLRDIPGGGVTSMNTALVNIKEAVNTTMREAYTKAIEDLEAAGARDTDKIQQIIMVRLNDGQTLTLEQLSKLNSDSWKNQIFGTDSIVLKPDDEYVLDLEGETLAKQQKLKAEEDEYRKAIQNEYLGSLRTILNQGQYITDAERELMTSFMRDVRSDLRKYELTSKMVDALDALSGLNEEVARGIKNYLIGFWGTVSFGKFNSKEIMKRLSLVKEYYAKYYGMSLEQLAKEGDNIKNQAEEVAWHTARYFKNLERMLGSVDGVTGVTTSKDVNKAFYHLGEVFNNLKTDDLSNRSIRGIFAMLSAIEQNQILKFFKFSNPGQLSYYRPFVQDGAGGKGGWLDGLGGYKDYAENINNINRDTFNRLFGSNFTDGQFKRIIQGLTGFTLAGGGLVRVLNQTLDVLNGSNILFRFLMSYPGQLLTIPLQGTAYFLKQIGHELALGLEDLGEIDNIREQFGILDGAYNELVNWQKLSFNPDSKDINSFYNRYGVPSVEDLYKDTGITTADDFVNMYAKLDTKYSKPGKVQRFFKWLDPYKDNANNFVDGIFARNFKNIAFVKGLKDNTFMKFGSARDFLAFMNDATVDSAIKSKLLDAVAASAGRNFRNILGLGFGGLDRAVGGAGWQNLLFGAMQMFNFRGSWGQNIVKQSGAAFWHMLQYLGASVGLTRATKDEIAKYIFHSPEFTNFMTAFMTDMEWAFKLTRYQDNGRWPDEDEDGIYYFLDYLSFMKENMNLVSQWWQGIQSFGFGRLFYEQLGSIMSSQMDPTLYQDTYGIGAFINALGKNFLRQWKPVNWLLDLIGAWEDGGGSHARAYIQNKFMNLSFGTIRYMVNEDTNGYGYTYEVTGQRGGIPAIMMGEAQMGSDKSFMYELDATETWKNLQLFADGDLPWSQRKEYGNNVRKAIVNGSQFFSSLSKGWDVTFGDYTKSFYTVDDLAETIQKTRAGKEFYQKGYVTPMTNAEASDFIKIILKNSEFRPGSTSFNKSLMNFEDFGHMDGKEGTKADAEMELWLNHMKYQTNGHGEFVLKDGQKVIDPAWTSLIENAKQYYGNEDYVANLVFNYSKAWLDLHNSDPNYPLYIKMLGQGQAHMLIETEIDKRVASKNKGAKKKDKRTEAQFNQAEYREMLLELGNSILPGDSITFFDKLNRLDTDDASLAALHIIYRESAGEDLKTLEKFFEPKTEIIDGEEVKSLEIKPQYEGVLKQVGNLSRAMDEGNVDRVVAMSSNLVNMYRDKDPAGLVTASIINSIYNNVYSNPNLTPSLRQEMMIGVFYKNKDRIQRNPTAMRELLGNNYDTYAKLMNEMLYKWDGQAISNLESIITSGKASLEETKKGSGLSADFKKLAMNFGDSGGGTTSTGKRAGQGYGQRVPVKVQGADLVKDLGLKGYSPLDIKYTVFKYNPHADFSLNKDVNRKVSGPKTEQVSSKKQLSNIEKKTRKALTAES